MLLVIDGDEQPPRPDRFVLRVAGCAIGSVEHAPGDVGLVEKGHLLEALRGDIDRHRHAVELEVAKVFLTRDHLAAGDDDLGILQRLFRHSHGARHHGRWRRRRHHPISDLVDHR